jgi:hypothetical protein
MCGLSRKGRFWVKRKTITKRMRAKLSEVNEELERRRHQPIPEQGQWLRSVVAGHLAYYAVPGNTDAVAAFSHPGDAELAQGAAASQPTLTLDLATDEPHCDQVATTRPSEASIPRHAVRRQNPRQQPSAVIPHTGICAGGRR